MPDWIQEFRGIAAGLGDLWLEKVVFQTTRRVSLEEIAGEDTPIAGLLQSIEGLELDGDSIMELLPDISGLQKKLPPEVFMGEEPLIDASSDRMAELRADVRELLIAKLLQHGGEQ